MSATTPIVKSIRAIPVAGHDSMLLNLSGAHGPISPVTSLLLKIILAILVLVKFRVARKFWQH